MGNPKYFLSNVLFNFKEHLDLERFILGSVSLLVLGTTITLGISSFASSTWLDFGKNVQSVGSFVGFAVAVLCFSMALRVKKD